MENCRCRTPRPRKKILVRRNVVPGPVFGFNFRCKRLARRDPARDLCASDNRLTVRVGRQIVRMNRRELKRVRRLQANPASAFRPQDAN